MRSTKRNNKNKVAVIVFALILAFLVAGATMAWLTKTSTLSNTFTVGSFTTPTTDPTDPTETISIDGNLYEPSWDSTEEHKLLPSATFDKDPYVGIGAGSEDAAVYVNVENNFSNKVYFTINSGWAPVSGCTTAGAASGTYTSGLFKYTAGLTGDEDDDVWTSTPLFSEIVVADDAEDTDFEVGAGNDTEIVVSSFIHQAKDSSGTAISSTTIDNAAKDAFNYT